MDRKTRVRTECVSCARVSPVVKRRDTSLETTRRSRLAKACRGADLRQRRDSKESGGVVPKHRVAAATGLESISLLARSPASSDRALRGRRRAALQGPRKACRKGVGL